jgi:hypothetical protein
MGFMGLLVLKLQGYTCHQPSFRKLLICEPLFGSPYCENGNKANFSEQPESFRHASLSDGADHLHLGVARPGGGAVMGQII